ncbi:hypothetical protein THMIRHAS_13280 [Thiosulfatimonas sediminis]|uniref:Uncharacterized protein n=1 Tax=Thiosulfatimonas sediminis TaxID=2675054 RepID=A0A6F8PV03_9GAMM|nr:hypothetical protein [Thiosulfatimonas sediminis]BBP45955.1 hypothetical protein THMIRHAS_13280 [Thiosulfatimonas sediminis]
MTIKADAQNIVNHLPDDASWEDLVKELYRQKKITLGLTDLEVVQNELSDADLNTIIARLKSSNSRPDDMRNTKTYTPGNAVTLGMIAGVIAILFSLVFPPISWVAAAVAITAGSFGVIRQEEKSWVPVLLALISLVPVINILT